MTLQARHVKGCLVEVDHRADEREDRSRLGRLLNPPLLSRGCVFGKLAVHLSAFVLLSL